MNKLSLLFPGTMIFLLLFYNQTAGLNISLFAVSIWFLSYRNFRSHTGSTQSTALSVSCWLSAISFAWYGDPLSFFALFTSTLVTTLLAQFPNLKLITLPLISFINLCTFPFRVFYFKHWIPGLKEWGNWRKRLAIVVLPLFFLTVFALVYSTGSNLFSEFFSNIFFNFDLIQIILLSLLAFFILFNMWVIWIPRLVIELNNELNDNYSSPKKKSIFPKMVIFDKDLERKSGEITFMLLNGLLIIFLAAYNYEQFFEASSRENLSGEIHERIATVICSIILAMGLILLYFRTKINQETENKPLIKLAFIWIILNLLLVVSASIKNTEYILQYGLTFKRISVFIFLILCCIGLYITYYKIKKQKTNTFLINKMAWVFYVTLMITAPVNFSWIVTSYNIQFHKTKDESYLKNLDFNKHILYEHYKNQPEWGEYFRRQKDNYEIQKQKSILSSYLYERYITLK